MVEHEFYRAEWMTEDQFYCFQMLCDVMGGGNHLCGVVTGFGKTYIYDRVKDGTLCKPIKISGRSRWKYRDHLEFKNKLISGCGG